MKIRLVKRKTPAMKRFSEAEWAIADLEHYGVKKDRHDEEDKFIKAYKRDELVGMLHYSQGAGTMELTTLIVSHSHRRNGIATILLKKAEEIARTKKIHKLFLVTGKDWSAIQLYKKFGFTKEADLPNHFHKKDFILMTKYLP